MAEFSDAQITTLFPEISDDLRQAYKLAVEEAGLSATDLYTIHDLLELSQLGKEENLHFLLLVLFTALGEGSPCVDISESSLASRLNSLNATSRAKFLVDDVEANKYSALIGEPGALDRPLIRLRTGDSCFVYFQKYLKHEQAAWKLLQERLIAADLKIDPKKSATVLKAVLDEKSSLNIEQRRAVKLALQRPLTIISGGPGTGKTSIVGSLLRCLVRLGIAPDHIALAAPTGRAAQRMSDSIHQKLHGIPTPLDEADTALIQHNPKAKTLHQLLGYSPRSGYFSRHEENPLPFEVVIVDEVSMVGLSLLAQLLRALPKESRLVLLGDQDQLPSVEAGAWLAHLKLTKFPNVLVMLETNYRSQQEIQTLAATINRQEISKIDQIKSISLEEDETQRFANRSGCWQLDPGSDLATWRSVLKSWTDQHFGKVDGDRSFLENAAACIINEGQIPPEVAGLFALVEKARILTFIREGPWGAAGVNQTIARFVRPSAERGSLFAGAPVMIIRNDYELGLFNGDVGLTLPAAGGGWCVVFPRAGNYMAVGADRLPAYELAFALTVHKSQGSEYDRVMLVAPPEGGQRLLTKELIYTGLTRAKSLAILCGPASVFRSAIGRKAERTSGVMRG